MTGLRLKKTKYNDNSTEEEFSESDFFELEPYKPPTFKYYFKPFMFLKLY